MSKSATASRHQVLAPIPPTPELEPMRFIEVTLLPDGFGQAQWLFWERSLARAMARDQKKKPT